ncbi:MAG: hypothetical protein ACXWLI_07230 [Myxococcaceae bacterium]
MTPEPVPESPAAGAGWLLRLGTRAAVSSWLPVLALAGVLAIAQAVQRMFWPSLFLGDPALRLEGTLLVAGGGCLVASVLARAVVTAIGVGTGAARLRTGAAAGVPPATAGLRGIAWAAAAVLVDLLLSSWFWGVLVASGVALVLGAPFVSLLGAAGFALALTLGILLGPAMALWLELGLVVSVVRPVRMGAAAGEALRLLVGRPGFLVGAWLVTAVPAGMLTAGVQVMAAGAPGPGWSAAGASGVALLLVAVVEALGTLIRLDALAALVLDGDGALPRPAPAPVRPAPVPRATLVTTEVVEARPVGPVAPWSPGE